MALPNSLKFFQPHFFLLQSFSICQKISSLRFLQFSCKYQKISIYLLAPPYQILAPTSSEEDVLKIFLISRSNSPFQKTHHIKEVQIFNFFKKESNSNTIFYVSSCDLLGKNIFLVGSFLQFAQLMTKERHHRKKYFFLFPPHLVGCIFNWVKISLKTVPEALCFWFLVCVEANLCFISLNAVLGDLCPPNEL